MPRLFQSALLRYRYEGLSPSELSVKGVRNDSTNRPPRAVIPRKGAKPLDAGISSVLPLYRHAENAVKHNHADDKPRDGENA